MAPVLRIGDADLGPADVLRALTESGRLGEALDVAIEHHLVAAEAGRRDLRIADADLQAAADRFRLERGLNSAADTSDWLGRLGLGVDDLESFVHHDLRRARLAEALFDEAAVAGRFEAVRDARTRAALSIARLDAQGLAAEILDQVESEEASFASLARDRSSHPSAAAGGLLGWVDLGDFPGPLAAAIASADAPAMLGPIEADGAWYVVALEAIARPERCAAVDAALREELLAAWLDERRRETPIEVRPA